ncbi:hypothetical protein [Streptomyces misionensis]
MSTAAADRGTALSVRETGDRRFRFGTAAAAGGAVMTSCASSTRSTAYSPRPTVVPLAVTAITDRHEVLGADREAVVKVTCNGSPLAEPPVMPLTRHGPRGRRGASGTHCGARRACAAA